MKKSIFIAVLIGGFLMNSCHQDNIENSLNQYENTLNEKIFHFGDSISLPKDILDDAESVTISLGDKETNQLKITPEFFTLGNNDLTFVIKTKNGKIINQDATISVYSSVPEKNMEYDIVAEYPHNTDYFTEGFQLEGNTIYESIGQNGTSKLLKYSLGSTSPSQSVQQSADIFSEGCVATKDKVYQLTWKNGKGFIYDKNTLSLVREFNYPNEGWGITFDRTNLITSDGSENIYFVSQEDPSKLVKKIKVAGNQSVYTKLNELEYHDGFIYANVWQTPYILKIDPKTGIVVGKFDFTQLKEKNTKGIDDVLNGIAFKGENMLITGKNWNKIYEIKIK